MIKLHRAAGALLTLACIGQVAAASADVTVEQGKRVYQQWCASCHANNDASPGTLALQAKYKGQMPAALAQRTDLNYDFVKYFVRNGISVMPFFRKTEVSDNDLKALAKYLSSEKK